MAAYTDQQPVFWFRDEITAKVVEGVTVWYDPVTSRYRLDHLPATSLGMSVAFHVSGERSTLPGNFDVWRTVDLREPGDRPGKKYDLQLEEIMHLLGPVDSAAIQPATDTVYSYKAPLSIQWQALD